MKTVIAGLEEGLNAIAEALGGGGGGSDIVPTPTAQDEGKVLKANDDGTASWENESGGVPSTVGHNLNEILVIDDTTINPPTTGWSALDEVLPQMNENNYPSNGDVIAYNSSTNKAEWQTPQGGGSDLPEITSEDTGKVLQANYDDKSGSGYAEWSRLTTGISEYYIGDVTSSSTWTPVTDGSDNTVAYKCLVSSGGLSTLLTGGVLAIKVSDGSYAYVDYFYLDDKSGGVQIFLTKDKYSLLSVRSELSGDTLVYLK